MLMVVMACKDNINSAERHFSCNSGAGESGIELLLLWMPAVVVVVVVAVGKEVIEASMAAEERDGDGERPSSGQVTPRVMQRVTDRGGRQDAATRRLWQLSPLTRLVQLGKALPSP